MKAILGIAIGAVLYMMIAFVYVGRSPDDVCIDLDTQRDRVLCNEAIRDTGTIAITTAVLVCAGMFAAAGGVIVWWREKAIENERKEMQQKIALMQARVHADALEYAERIRQHYAGRLLQQPTQLFMDRGVEVRR